MPIDRPLPITILAAVCFTGSTLAAQSASPKEPELRWGPVPGLFPRGAQLALVSGDPFKAVPLTVLLSLPDGYKMPPHFHRADEHVEVRQGTILVGMGDKFDVGKTKRMEVGDTGTAPAGTHHFAMAKGATIVAVTMMGPYVTTYVRPADEPWSVFPYGY
jgi:quercetin dioxygenase-like cupin family protein